LSPSAVEKRVGGYEKRVGSFVHETCEGCVDLTTGAGVKGSNLQSRVASSRLHFSHGGEILNGGRVHEHGHTCCPWHQLTQEFHPLCGQLGNEEIDTCQVAAGSGEAGDKTKPDRVVGREKDDGDPRGCRLGRQRRRGTGGSDDHANLLANQFSRQFRQAIVLPTGPAIYDRYVLALDIAVLLQALSKSAQAALEHFRRGGTEEPNDRHRRLLRTRR